MKRRINFPVEKTAGLQRLCNRQVHNSYVERNDAKLLACKNLSVATSRLQHSITELRYTIILNRRYGTPDCDAALPE